MGVEHERGRENSCFPAEEDNRKPWVSISRRGVSLSSGLPKNAEA